WRLPLHSRRGRRRLPGAACAFRRIAIETLRERSLWCSIVGKSKAFGCIDTVAGLPVLSARARLAGFAMLNDNKGDVVAGGKIQDQPCSSACFGRLARRSGSDACWMQHCFHADAWRNADAGLRDR